MMTGKMGWDHDFLVGVANLHLVVILFMIYTCFIALVGVGFSSPFARMVIDWSLLLLVCLLSII